MPALLQYRIDGPDDAPVLVLGPSLGATWHMWDRQVADLSREWRVVRYDLPGHGGAPAEPAESVAELADRLLATLDAVGVQRFGYAGCSIGGAVGLDLALRRPDRVGSLALVAASPRFGTADEFRGRGVIVRTNGLEPVALAAPAAWFTEVFAAAQPAIVEWAVQMVRTTDPACYIAACEALATFDVRTELGRVAVPALVLVGAEDQVTGPAEARTLVAGIPDARLALVPGASHLAPVEQPAAVTDLLVQHFSTAPQDTLTAIPLQPQPAAPVSPAAPPAVPAVAAVPAGAGAPEPVGRPDPYEPGMKTRREVLGDAYVDAATAGDEHFTAEFQELVTRYAWGEVWNREGLDRRTRSAVTMTALVAGGHLEELAVHVRAALRNGLTPGEIKEILIHTAVYCGVPAANAAFGVARAVVREETTPRS
ncbi:alpha/beta fold hydrolase [Streptomyces qinzhouensis]|uniref:Alpha/beta fold hydrolase n=1 Tax=Streptomyces qinzhouensis TaxID=2599401 RepID=A0A5B8IRK7_9ACTN|nr:alpha/beta fold hydrolase [Streptomyces qinzhouensis]QDY81348.1 alpha/beta fold hydrolase [Streptomyces qinzhouensis]